MPRLWTASHAAALAIFLIPVVVACAPQSSPAPAAATSKPADSSKPAESAKPTEAPKAAAPAPTAPAKEAAKPATAPTGGTFVIAELGPLPNTLHPYPDSAAYNSAWVDTWTLMGVGLLEQDANTLEYRGYLASDYNVAPDGKTFTFKLRDGLKWSDGKPIVVDDFVYGWTEGSKDENDYVGLDDLKRIESVTTPDPATIVVRLKETLARDVAIGVANSIGPVPKHIWQGKSWNDPASNPEILKPTVVAGPYLLKEWKQAESATFERNPNWFKGQPSFERVVLRPGQQPTVAYELLKSNQAQWAREVPPSQYTEAKQNPNLTMYEWTAANGLYRVLDFNLEHPFLKDKRVREALARAINRQDIIQVAENNLGQPQYSFLNPTNTKWYNAGVEKYEFDLGRSRQLLQDAGYRLEGGRLLGSDGQPVKLRVLFPVTSKPREKIATYMQQQYKQLGIDLEVKGLDALAYFEESKKKNFDLSLNSWGGGSIDPDLGPKSQLKSDGTQNYTGFKSARVDELFEKGAVEPEDAKRKAIYDEIQKTVADDLPSFYLYSATSFSPMSKRVTGVQTNKLDRLDSNDAMTRWQITQ